MKTAAKTVLLTIMVLSCLLLFTSCSSDRDTSLMPMSSGDMSLSMMRIINPDTEIRGVWIASVYNIDYPSSTDLSADSLKAEIDAIISTCLKNGLNTVFFQVRPSCDALYQSDIFPVSKWLSSTGDLCFDPLEYFVKEAKLNNIFLYAWVNPLRISVDTNDINSLPKGSPAYDHPDWVVEYSGKLYFNPGIPEVRDFVADGVREIVKKYDVDGVVFDDYFYPYPVQDASGSTIKFNDSLTFGKYGADFDNIYDWRRDNINSLIQSCYNAVHSEDAECVFGVSPFGVWQNNNGTNGGSDTANLEGYNDLYCDALAWAKGGYVDFLSPQIYWRFDNKTSRYDVVLRWWNSKLDGTGVKLIVSHACYQYDDGWTSPEMEMNEQVSYARSEKTYYGSAMYGYDEIKRNVHGLSDELAELFSDEIVYTNIISTGTGVNVTSPVSGTTTSQNYTYLIGACDPYYPLTLNGSPVSMTKSGYFNLYEELTKGENIFVFEQNGVEYPYVITYDPNPSSGLKTDKVKNIDSLRIDSFYPSCDIATSEGNLTVSCTAPYGYTLTAELNGEIFPLSSTEHPIWGGDGYPAVTYEGTLYLPEAEDDEILDCGNIVFKMSGTYADDEIEGPKVRVLGKGALIAVETVNDYAELKVSKNSLYYNDYTVQSAGMTDYADNLSDGFYHLRMGGYISAENVKETETSLPEKGSIVSSVLINNTGDTTDIIFSSTDNLPYNGTVEDGKFVLTLYNTSGEYSGNFDIGDNPLISDATSEYINGRTRFYFSLYDTDNFYGFDLKYEKNTITVSLINPKSLDFSSDKPLSGITVVLDAGHGGYDRGASGCADGKDEKDINLVIVTEAGNELKKLGADVLFTRDDDSYISLYERIAFLEEKEPDICISVHQNSADYTSDIRSLRGTLGLYCMDSGVMLAKCVSSEIATALGRWCQDARYQMLAVCRNPKFPSALVEIGYMTSVEEYEEITSERGIRLAVSGIVDGIMKYFSKQVEYSIVRSD